MITPRAILVLLVAALAALTGLSCAPRERPVEDLRDEDGRIVIEFWHAMTRGHARSINEIADAFNASQDRYRVRAIYQGNYASLQQKLIASLYAGRQPAMAQMYESWTTRFLKFGCLQPVRHFQDCDPSWGEAEIEDIFPRLRANSSFPLVLGDDGAYRLDAERGEPTLTTLPFNKSVYMLYVNDDLMREVGYDQPPRTWAELKDLARRMTVVEDGVVQRYGCATRRLIEAYTPLLMTAGANYMEEGGEFALLDEPAVSAMEFLQDLVLGPERVGYVEDDYLSNAFGSGRVGMYYGSTASFPFNDSAVANRFIWRAYPLPGRDEDTPGFALMQGTNVGIFLQGFNGMGRLPEDVQQGAWEFLKFLVNPENTAKWAMDSGYLPVRRSAAELPVLRDYLESNENFANAFSQMDRLEAEPRPIWWDNIRTILNREVGSVLDGRRSPREALESATRKARVIQQTAG